MRLVLVTAALLLTTVAARAEEVYAPDNMPGAGTCNAIPFSSSFMSGEARYQALVPQSMLGSGFLVRELSFAPCAASPNFQATNLTIVMAHSVSTMLSSTFATNLAGNATTVYSGPVNLTAMQNMWTPIGLTSGFLYNGVDSLVVEVTYTGATGGWSCHRGTTMPRAYARGAGASTNPTAQGTDLASLKMRFTVDRTQLLLSGSPTPGGQVTLDLLSPGDAGLSYVLGASFGNGPIPIDTRTLGLTPDDLLVVTTGNLLPTVFVNYRGVLDASGMAQATMNLLNDPRLSGIRIYNAFITLSASAPSGVRSISPSVLLSIN